MGTEPRVGDEGQRYEVRCIGDGNKEMVMGWTDEADGGGMAKSVKLHPVWHHCTVIDRQPEPNYAQVRAAAEKATEGPWIAKDRTGYVFHNNQAVCDCGSPQHVPAERNANADFIAITDPTNTIAMLDEIKLQTTLAGGWEVDAIARRKEIAILQAENKRLRKVLKREELVNMHAAVCFHNLLARHGNDESKKLFRDELGYGKDDFSVDETCGFGLKMLAEAGNKNAQTGKADYFEHPALKSAD